MPNEKKESKLNLILGGSGGGKSFYIKEKIKDICSNKEFKIMLIVPEQDSFETEKAILGFLGAENANKIVVTSFKRLVDFVFRQVGGLAGTRLNDSGRNIFMNLAVEEVKEHMEVYNEKIAINDIVDIMISALKEFKINSISVDLFLETIKNVDDKILRSKVKDTALILEAYDALISQSYIEPLDDLTRLSNKLAEYDLFAEYTIFIDEFDGFTPQELSVLERLIIQCRECYIALRADDIDLNDNGISLFSPVHKTIKKLIDLSKKNGIEINKPKVMKSQYRFKSNELKHLEASIFRSNPKCFNNEVKDVLIYSASEIYDELNFVANTIKRLVIEESYCYHDFAVIARDLNTYRGVLDSIFDKHNIPYFMDIQQDIDSKPIMNMVISLFDIIHSSFSTEYIFMYLKTGIPNISTDDLSIIENYVMLWDINNKAWLEDFKSNPSGFSSRLKESEEALLLKINDVRKKIINPIIKFSEKIKSNNADTITKAIYDFLIDIEADKSVMNLSEKLRNIGEHNLADEQIRLWDLLMDILDQMSLVLKGRYINSKKYYEIIKLVISSEKIAFIPQSLDEVIIGDADRIRLKDKKVVFIIGAVDGEFPRSPVSSGVFNDSERKLLISLGIPMYESLENLVIEERFLAYTSMMSSSDKLFLSWPMSSVSGGSNYPSSIIKGTKKVFPSLKIKDEYSLSNEYKVYSEKPAFELCAKNWNNNSRFAKSLKFYFGNKEEYKVKIQALERASNLKPFKFDDYNNAEKLFGKEMVISASQVEKFYLCKFQYFCKYGLLAEKQEPYMFNTLEYGKLIHFLMENVLSMYSIAELKSMEKASIKSLINETLNNYLEKNLDGIDGKTERFKYLFYRVNNVMMILINHIIEEFSQSEFVPLDFELDISERGDILPLKLETSNGCTIKIKGKIDRVDIMKKNGKSYIRIIDYKTGVKDFRLSDVIYGLNAQMLIYLLTVCKNGRSRYGDIVPAGVLYMPCNKPLLNANRNITEDELNNEINKKLKMNGLILENSEVIQGMEKEAKGIYIPVSLNDGKLRKLDNVVSLHQMESIMGHLENLIVSMCETLRLGDISANPAIGEYDACRYCSYKTICGNEDKSLGRIVEKLDRETTIKTIVKNSGEEDV